MKVHTIQEAKKLTDIPNVGPRVAEDLVLLGIYTPADLVGKNAYTLYTTLCTKTNTRHDPCVLDTFMAAVDFAGGAPAQKWWHYTPKRKKQWPNM